LEEAKQRNERSRENSEARSSTVRILA
jgi:hypothetical protein